MRIAINSPTGNTGRPIAEKLVETDNDVVLLARDRNKVAPLADRGAEIKQGVLEDGGFVEEATRGVDALYWITPADYGADDLRAWQRRLGENVSNAVRENRISRVVDLSSVGAHLAGGTGPIVGLGEIERMLDDTGASTMHIRADYFMENTLMSLPSIVSDGAIYNPCPGNTLISMIAAADIADTAVKALQDDTWSGHNVLELAGPAVVSYDSCAAALGRAIDKKIKHVQIPADAFRTAAARMGMSEDVIGAFLEMYDGFTEGRIVHEREPVRTGTTIDEFAKTVFKQAFDGLTTAG